MMISNKSDIPVVTDWDLLVFLFLLFAVSDFFLAFLLSGCLHRFHLSIFFVFPSHPSSFLSLSVSQRRRQSVSFSAET